MLLPLKLKEQIRLRSKIIKREFYLTFHHLTLYFKLDIKQSTSINIFDPIIESLCLRKISGFLIFTGQTLQLARKKCMAKGCFDLQNNDFWREIVAFSPLFHQKWMWMLLIQGQCKFLFE